MSLTMYININRIRWNNCHLQDNVYNDINNEQNEIPLGFLNIKRKDDQSIRLDNFYIDKPRMIIICLLESSNHLCKGFIHQNEQTNSSLFFDLSKAIKIIKVTPGGNTIHVTKKIALKWAIV